MVTPREALTWIRSRPWLGAIAVMGLTLVVTIGLVERQDERGRERDREQATDIFVSEAVQECRSANQSRGLIRDIGVQLNVAAVSASTEALIIVVSASDTPPDPEIIAEYRRISLEQAETRAQAIVAQLEDRNCEQEGRDARRKAENQLG